MPSFQSLDVSKMVKKCRWFYEVLNTNVRDTLKTRIHFYSSWKWWLRFEQYGQCRKALNAIAGQMLSDRCNANTASQMFSQPCEWLCVLVWVPGLLIKLLAVCAPYSGSQIVCTNESSVWLASRVGWVLQGTGRWVEQMSAWADSEGKLVGTGVTLCFWFVIINLFFFCC